MGCGWRGVYFAVGGDLLLTQLKLLALVLRLSSGLATYHPFSAKRHLKFVPRGPSSVYLHSGAAYIDNRKSPAVMTPGPSSLRPLAWCWTSIAQSMKAPLLRKPTIPLINIVKPSSFTRSFIVGMLYLPPRLHSHSQLAASLTPPPCHPSAVREPKRRIKIFPPVKGPSSKNPIDDLTKAALAILDPSGARQKMFSRYNKDSIRPGDILQVRRRNGDPFSGVLLNIRRRGVDTAFLLRDQLTRVGVEMWFKLYSPAIEDIDLVQRKAKKARRAKLYYMRYNSLPLSTGVFSGGSLGGCMLMGVL